MSVHQPEMEEANIEQWRDSTHKDIAQTAQASITEYQNIRDCVEATVDSFRLLRVWKLGAGSGGKVR